MKSSNGQVIYRDTQNLMNHLTAADVAERRQRRFALEGRLPASPGAYTLALTVTNKVHTSGIYAVAQCGCARV